MPLAPQVADPGSRGQDARYKFDPSYMTDLGGGFYTDGQYTYRGDPESMLAEDRPSVRTGSLPPADDTDSVLRYSRSLRTGQGVPQAAAPPPPPEMVAMPKLKMGEQLQTPFVETPFQTGQPQADQFFHDFIAPLSAKYVDKAAFQKDWDAMAAGTPNFAPLRQVVAPQVAAAVRAPVTNPYGTLGPSPQRVRAVQSQNPYGGLGPSPQRVANVKAAAKSMAPGMARPLGSKPIPMKAAPTPTPKPVLAKAPVKKPPPKRSGR
jgi:hypothetical protein